MSQINSLRKVLEVLYRIAEGGGSEAKKLAGLHSVAETLSDRTKRELLARLAREDLREAAPAGWAAKPVVDQLDELRSLKAVQEARDVMGEHGVVGVLGNPSPREALPPQRPILSVEEKAKKVGEKARPKPKREQGRKSSQPLKDVDFLMERRRELAKAVEQNLNRENAIRAAKGVEVPLLDRLRSKELVADQTVGLGEHGDEVGLKDLALHIQKTERRPTAWGAGEGAGDILSGSEAELRASSLLKSAQTRRNAIKEETTRTQQAIEQDSSMAHWGNRQDRKGVPVSAEDPPNKMAYAEGRNRAASEVNALLRRVRGLTGGRDLRGKRGIAPSDDVVEGLRKELSSLVGIEAQLRKAHPKGFISSLKSKNWYAGVRDSVYLQEYAGEVVDAASKVLSPIEVDEVVRGMPLVREALKNRAEYVLAKELKVKPRYLGEHVAAGKDYSSFPGAKGWKGDKGNPARDLALDALARIRKGRYAEGSLLTKAANVYADELDPAKQMRMREIYRSHADAMSEAYAPLVSEMQLRAKGMEAKLGRPLSLDEKRGIRQQVISQADTTPKVWDEIDAEHGLGGHYAENPKVEAGWKARQREWQEERGPQLKLEAEVGSPDVPSQQWRDEMYTALETDFAGNKEKFRGRILDARNDLSRWGQLVPARKREVRKILEDYRTEVKTFERAKRAKGVNAPREMVLPRSVRAETAEALPLFTLAAREGSEGSKQFLRESAKEMYQGRHLPNLAGRRLPEVVGDEVRDRGRPLPMPSEVAGQMSFADLDVPAPEVRPVGVEDVMPLLGKAKWNDNVAGFYRWLESQLAGGRDPWPVGSRTLEVPPVRARRMEVDPRRQMLLEDLVGR